MNDTRIRAAKAACDDALTVIADSLEETDCEALEHGQTYLRWALSAFDRADKELGGLHAMRSTHAHRWPV